MIAPRGRAAVMREIMILVYSGEVSLTFSNRVYREEMFTSSYPKRKEPRAALTATRYTSFLSLSLNMNLFINQHQNFIQKSIKIIHIICIIYPTSPINITASLTPQYTSPEAGPIFCLFFLQPPYNLFHLPI